MKLFPLTESARLPYEKIKGSIVKRDNFAKNMTFSIVENVQQEMAHGDISMCQLRRVLKKTVPKNIDLVVEKNVDDNIYASLNTLAEENFTISGYSLEVGLNKKGKVSRADLPTIGHEMRHLSDYLAFPKVPARECKLDRTGLYTKKYFDFYESEVYIDEVFSSQKEKDAIIKTLKKKIQKFLKGFKPEEKIDYLQCMRYGLIFEKNAYQTENEIAKQFLQKKDLSKYRRNVDNCCEEFMFPEKIELLKKMALEIISTERNKHHARLKRNEYVQDFLNKFTI